MNVLSHFSCVWLLATLWTIAYQVPLSTGLSRQEYWSGLPCPFPGDLPDPGVEPISTAAPALLLLSHWGSSLISLKIINKIPTGNNQICHICKKYF